MFTSYMYVNFVLMFFAQVRLRKEVLRTPSLTRLGFELMTSRSWQHISCHWYPCSNRLAISDCMQKKISYSLIAGITDSCLFWFSVWGWGGYLGHKGAQAVLSFHGISMLPFQKEYGVCLYKCPTIVMINRCENETGKVSFVFSMWTKVSLSYYTFKPW